MPKLLTEIDTLSGHNVIRTVGKVTRANNLALSKYLGPGINVVTSTPSAPAGWNGVAWNGSVYCAVCSATTCVTSPDGITWTQRTVPSGQWQAITWNGSVFCMVAVLSTLSATSPDGITWTQGTLPASLWWKSVIWNGSFFLAMADSNASQYATSTNGLSWTLRDWPVGANRQGIAWNGSVFCTMGTQTPTFTFYTSTDGVNWTPNTPTIPGGGSWFMAGIVWNGSVFCATGIGGPEGWLVATSPDGVNWKFSKQRVSKLFIPSFEAPSRIAWNGTYFIAGAGSTGKNFYISKDGLNWTTLGTPERRNFIFARPTGQIITGTTNVLELITIDSASLGVQTIVDSKISSMLV